MQNARNVAVRADTDINATDDEIMRLGFGDFVFFAGVDPFVLIMPLCERQTDRAFRELRQVLIDEPGGLAGSGSI